MTTDSKALAQRDTANLANVEKESEDVARRELAVARGRAKVVADLIRERHLFVTINDKDYVECEGWTTLAGYYFLVPDIEWTRPLPDGAGWEARARLVNMQTGECRGTGEAECRYEETKWQDQDSYALRSMAQTRAVSKVCRLRLSAVMVLAGFAATPAEEVQKEKREIVPCRECSAPTTLFRDGKARGHKLPDGRWHRQSKDWRPAAPDAAEGQPQPPSPSAQDVPTPAAAPATKPEAPAGVVEGEAAPIATGRLIPPKNIAELMQRANAELGLPFVEAKKVLGIKAPLEIGDLNDAWAKLCAAAIRGKEKP